MYAAATMRVRTVSTFNFESHHLAEDKENALYQARHSQSEQRYQHFMPNTVLPLLKLDFSAKFNSYLERPIWIDPPTELGANYYWTTEKYVVWEYDRYLDAIQEKEYELCLALNFNALPDCELQIEIDSIFGLKR